MGFAKDLIDAGVKVVDLSADYRLDLETYEANYCSHIDSKNLKYSAYGLIEYYREEIRKAKVVGICWMLSNSTLLGVSSPFYKYLDRLLIPLFYRLAKGPWGGSRWGGWGKGKA